MKQIKFLFLLLSVVLIYSCDDNIEEIDNPDSQNFLSGTVIEDLYGNDNYKIFLFAIEKSEDFSIVSNEPSTVEILKKNNPIIGDVFAVFIPTDSSLQELYQGAFDNYTDGQWYVYVRSHIHLGPLSLNSTGTLDMLEDRVDLLGGNQVIDLSNESINFYAEGFGFDNRANKRADAILTSEGVDLITDGDSRVHSIEGDFVNITPWFGDGLRGTWTISEASTVDGVTNLTGVTITFNTDNNTYTVSGLGSLNDNDLNHSDIFAPNGTISVNSNQDMITLSPGGTINFTLVDEVLTLTYNSNYPKATDPPSTIILSAYK